MLYKCDKCKKEFYARKEAERHEKNCDRKNWLSKLFKRGGLWKYSTSRGLLGWVQRMDKEQDELKNQRKK